MNTTIHADTQARWDAEAEATAEQHGWDTHVLRFHYTRYQFGSLANNWEARDMRRKYWNALQLAEARKASGTRDVLQAAE